jgi:hypothetical protein
MKRAPLCHDGPGLEVDDGPRLKVLAKSKILADRTGRHLSIVTVSVQPVRAHLSRAGMIAH